MNRRDFLKSLGAATVAVVAVPVVGPVVYGTITVPAGFTTDTIDNCARISAYDYGTWRADDIVKHWPDAGRIDFAEMVRKASLV